MRPEHVTTFMFCLVVSLLPISWMGCTRESSFDKIDRWKSEANAKRLTDVLEGRAMSHDIFIWEYREKAARALGEIGDPRSVAPLISALKNAGPNVREAVVEALGKIGEPAVEPLMDALNHESSDIRRGAAQALGEIKDRRAVEALITTFVEDQDVQVRQSAADALGEIQDQRATHALVPALRTSAVSQQAAEALIRIGRPAVDPLVAQLDIEVAKRHRDLYGRREDSERADTAFISSLVHVLSEMNDSHATNSVTAAMQDGTIGPTTEVVRFLGSRLSDTRPAPLLIRWLGAADLEVAEEAALWLGTRKDRRAVRPLLDRLNAIAPEFNSHLRRYVTWSHSPDAGGYYYTTDVRRDLQAAARQSRFIKAVTVALSQFEEDKNVVVPELIDIFPVIIEVPIGFATWTGSVRTGGIMMAPRAAPLPADREVPTYVKVFIGAHALTKLTGADVGDDQELWRQWWKENK